MSACGLSSKDAVCVSDEYQNTCSDPDVDSLMSSGPENVGCALILQSTDGEPLVADCSPVDEHLTQVAANKQDSSDVTSCAVPAVECNVLTCTIPIGQEAVSLVGLADEVQVNEISDTDTDGDDTIAVPNLLHSKEGSLVAIELPACTKTMILAKLAEPNGQQEVDLDELTDH